MDASPKIESSDSASYVVHLGWNRDLSTAALKAIASEYSLVAWPFARAIGDPTRLAQMGFVHRVTRFLGIGSVSELPFDPDEVIESPYAVRVTGERRLSSSMRRALLAAVWDSTTDPRVDLGSPATELHAVITSIGVIWSVSLPLVRYEPSRAHERPFVRSYVVPSRRARMLLDLGGVVAGSSVLDPFCGTGSILIEAARLGANAFGSDLDGDAIAGARTNAAFESERIDLRVLDAANVQAWDRQFDAIVTDIPYGRSASLRGLDVGDLVDPWLEQAGAALQANGRLVAMSPAGTMPSTSATLDLCHRIAEPVHRSLTREIVVYTKKH